MSDSSGETSAALEAAGKVALDAAQKREQKREQKPQKPAKPQKPKQKRTLTRAKIIKTALAILDARGSDALNMRNIASELGVQQSALYRHISGRDDLLAEIRLLVAKNIVDHDFEGLTWDEALTTLAYLYRDAFAAHPAAIPLLTSSPLGSSRDIILTYDWFLRILTEAGWQAADALDILNAFDSFLLGSALDLASGQEILDPGGVEEAVLFQKSFAARNARNAKNAATARNSTNATTAKTAATATTAKTGSSGANSAFELGVRVFINGLRFSLSERR